MKGRSLTVLLAILFLTLLAAGMVIAQASDSDKGVESPYPQEALSLSDRVSARISYQGVLKEDGEPVDGTRTMTFTLYSDAVCTDTVRIIGSGPISISNGLFTTELDVTPADFDGQGLWLGIEVGDVAIACREILPVPYALSLRPGAVISDTTSKVVLNRYRLPDSKYGIRSEVGGSFDSAYGVYGRATATSGTTYGVYGETKSPLGAGVYGYTSAPDGETVGVKGETLSPIGYGVAGVATASSGPARGIFGLSYSEEGRGVLGAATATSGTNYGVLGRSHSANGYGGYFENEGGGKALYADGDAAQSLAGNGFVKAAVAGGCLWVPNGSCTVDRSFNNVGGTIIVTPGASAGEFTIELGFDVSERFWAATLTEFPGYTIACRLGSSDSQLDCDVQGSANLSFMVLVY